MTEIKLYIDKSVEQNAEVYFEKAKKLKKKIAGAKEAIEQLKKQIEKLEAKKIVEVKEVKKIQRKKDWYEKFRWTLTSEGKLVVAGRDATTNDILIKKQMNSNDLVFHADIAGSPFCIIKDGKNKCSENELREVAQFCAANSKAFKLNLSNVDVYWIFPEQVSLEAPSGEYLTKGAFMVYGKKNIINCQIKIAIGLMKDGKVLSGHADAVKKHCDFFLSVVPGDVKKSDLAKKIQNYFLKKANVKVDEEEIMQALPPGDGRIT